MRHAEHAERREEVGRFGTGGLGPPSRLARTALVPGRLTLSLVAVLALAGCDWFTNVAFNRSKQSVIVTASRGPNAGKSYRLDPGKALTVHYGSFSRYVTIRTDALNSQILFDGHACEGDWILNVNDADLVVDPALHVSCIRLKDLPRDLK